MSGKWSLKRGILHTLIVALVLSASVGIYASDLRGKKPFQTDFRESEAPAEPLLGAIPARREPRPPRPPSLETGSTRNPNAL